jgi:hypothetical protein
LEGGDLMKINKLALTLVTFVLASNYSVAHADSLSVSFESPTYNTGTVHLQDGWSSFGAAGSGCALYDHMVDSSFGFVGFGLQSLRLSNAVTSGCFSDQTFSKSLTQAAGEATAEGGTHSSAPMHTYFSAEWDFASVTKTYQPGLSVVASPDRGDGARMSWVQMADAADGLQVNFYDYQKATVDKFILTTVASGLDRNVSHKVKVTMSFVDGEANDVVKVYVDGVLKHTGTSWEDYFREQEGNPTRTVDSVLFRTGGTAVPDVEDEGFVIDNLTLLSGPLLVSMDQCKNDGWKTFVDPSFKNQGDCVSYVQSNAKAVGNRAR